MKRCPECRRDYYDDSLLYCLDDGSAQLEGPASGNEPATLIFSEQAGPVSDSSESRTAIISPPETEGGMGGTQEIRRSGKRLLILLPLFIAIIAVGAFFGYRY